MVARRTSMEIRARHEEHGYLYWLGHPESKTLRPVWWWNYVNHLPRGRSRLRRSLEGRPRPPYIGWRALGYKLVYIYPSRLQHGRLIRAGLACLVHQAAFVSFGHMLGRAGSTDRSADLLVGRARLTGTTEALVGGEWGPRGTHVSQLV
jgi:hypothetical protein